MPDTAGGMGATKQIAILRAVGVGANTKDCQGRTAFVSEDVRIWSSDSILIEGVLMALPDEERAGNNAPTVELAAQHVIEIPGMVLGTAAPVFPASMGMESPRMEGAAGTSISLVAPVIIVDGVVRAGTGGPGGKGCIVTGGVGGTGGRGGKGGTGGNGGDGFAFTGPKGKKSKDGVVCDQ